MYNYSVTSKRCSDNIFYLLHCSHDKLGIAVCIVLKRTVKHWLRYSM